MDFVEVQTAWPKSAEAPILIANHFVQQLSVEMGVREDFKLIAVSSQWSRCFHQHIFWYQIWIWFGLCNHKLLHFCLLASNVANRSWICREAACCLKRMWNKNWWRKLRSLRSASLLQRWHQGMVLHAVCSSQSAGGVFCVQDGTWSWWFIADAACLIHSVFFSIDLWCICAATIILFPKECRVHGMVLLQAPQLPVHVLFLFGCIRRICNRRSNNGFDSVWCCLLSIQLNAAGVPSVRFKDLVMTVIPQPLAQAKMKQCRI